MENALQFENDQRLEANEKSVWSDILSERNIDALCDDPRHSIRQNMKRVFFIGYEDLKKKDFQRMQKITQRYLAYLPELKLFFSSPEFWDGSNFDEEGDLTFSSKIAQEKVKKLEQKLNSFSLTLKQVITDVEFLETLLSKNVNESKFDELHDEIEASLHKKKFDFLNRNYFRYDIEMYVVLYLIELIFLVCKICYDVRMETFTVGNKN